MSCYGSRGLWEQMHFGHKSFLSIYVRGWNKGGIYFVWNAENIYGFSPPSIEKNCHQRSYFSNCIISATFPPEKIAESWIFTNVSETAQVMNGEGQREQLNLRILGSRQMCGVRHRVYSAAAGWMPGISRGVGATSRPEWSVFCLSKWLSWTGEG